MGASIHRFRGNIQSHATNQFHALTTTVCTRTGAFRKSYTFHVRDDKGRKLICALTTIASATTDALMKSYTLNMYSFSHQIECPDETIWSVPAMNMSQLLCRHIIDSCLPGTVSQCLITHQRMSHLPWINTAKNAARVLRPSLKTAKTDVDT